MKKTVLKIVALLVLVLFVTLALAACGKEKKSVPASEGLAFTTNGDGTCTLTGLGMCMDREIVIPAKAPNGASVTAIAEEAFKNSLITGIVIPDSVTSIGNEAFRDCSGLTSVKIGNGVTSIGNEAFYGCSGLTSVTIPDSVTNIGSSALTGCSGLTSITIGNGVTFLPSGLLSRCSSLESITIPFVGGSRKTASDTDQYPFGYIFGTNSYTGGVATTKHYIYSTKTYYYIPSSLKSVMVTGGEIPYGAFLGCSGLTSVTIGNGVTSIGIGAFCNCTGLTSVTIPNSITSIGEGAFCDCSGLTSITIPDSVTSIGSDAFYKCTELTSVTIGDGVTSIGECAFLGCTGLTSVTIGNGVTSIGNSAFEGCIKLIEVRNLSALNITAGSSENGSVGDCAKRVYSDGESYLHQTDDGYLFYDDRTDIYLVAYYGTDTNLILPENYNGKNYGIYRYAFYNCSGLTSVTIGDGVTSIGELAFFGCSGLTEITIPDSVTSIGNYAFNDCSGLTSITIGNSVTSIEKNAFNGCVKLIEVCNLSALNITARSSEIGSVGYYAKHVYSDGESFLHETDDGYLFYDDRTDIYLVAYYGTDTNLILPENYNGKNYGIYRYAFYNCSGLTEITIPDSVTSIGQSAFSGCTGLTSVTIPDSVTDIGVRAFQYCSRLTSINFTGTKTQWNAISKATSRDSSTNNYTIHCTDGDIAK